MAHQMGILFFVKLILKDNLIWEHFDKFDKGHGSQKLNILFIIPIILP